MCSMAAKAALFRAFSLGKSASGEGEGESADVDGVRGLKAKNTKNTLARARETILVIIALDYDLQVVREIGGK